MSNKVLIDKEELELMFRNGINMWGGKSNISQICENINSCKTYKLNGEPTSFWQPYTKNSQLKEHTLYLVVGEAIIGKGNYYYKLCRYANKLCDVDSSDFPEHKYNYSSFYFYDNECGYVNLDNVKFYMEVPEVPKENTQ